VTWFDYAVLTIIAVSVLFGVIHGFVRELLALLSWIAAFFVAQKFTAEVTPWLTKVITVPWLRTLVAFAGIFLAVLLLMSLLAYLLTRIVKGGGLGWTDRVLGAVFGFARGLAIVILAVLVAGLTPLPRDPAWRNASFSAPLMALAEVVRLWLPAGLAKQITFTER